MTTFHKTEASGSISLGPKKKRSLPDENEPSSLFRGTACRSWAASKSDFLLNADKYD